VKKKPIVTVLTCGADGKSMESVVPFKRRVPALVVVLAGVVTVTLVDSATPLLLNTSTKYV
jgi:hypothetical protein